MKLDLNLLKRLLVVDHPSKQEWPMISFIINECYRIPHLTFEMDSYANIFITKNTTNPEYYPCVVAHMDCVLPHKNKEVIIKNGIIRGRDKLSGKRIGLGADDAVGICVALQLLKAIPDLKVCFTNEEEIGFIGAEVASENLDFFYNVSYLIQADRRGSSDVITYTNGINSASEAWMEEISGIMAAFNYSEHMGIGTDIGVLAEKLQISGVNISCGYNKEHTDDEYVVIKDLQNCLAFIETILYTVPIDKQYEIVINYRPYTINPYPKRDLYPTEYENLDYYDGMFTDWENICKNCPTMDCMHCPYDSK